MKRRDFLMTGASLGLFCMVDLHASETISTKIEQLIAAVQEHMFPAHGTLPSAKEMRATAFLIETIMHPSYDKDIRNFVIEGAEVLHGRSNGKFVLMNETQKEHALREYESTSYGSHWLARIMILSMEALFCDPIYGSNINQSGWKAVENFGGEPRPRTRYIAL